MAGQRLSIERRRMRSPRTGRRNVVSRSAQRIDAGGITDTGIALCQDTYLRSRGGAGRPAAVETELRAPAGQYRHGRFRYHIMSTDTRQIEPGKPPNRTENVGAVYSHSARTLPYSSRSTRTDACNKMSGSRNRRTMKSLATPQAPAVDHTPHRP